MKQIIKTTEIKGKVIKEIKEGKKHLYMFFKDNTFCAFYGEIDFYEEMEINSVEFAEHLINLELSYDDTKNKELLDFGFVTEKEFQEFYKNKSKKTKEFHENLEKEQLKKLLEKYPNFK